MQDVKSANHITMLVTPPPLEEVGRRPITVLVTPPPLERPE